MARKQQPNAFSDAFLSLFDQHDQPVTASEAELSGPWRVESIDSALHAVFQEGEAQPKAAFFELQTAQLMASVLPALGQNPAFALQNRRERSCFPILEVRGESGLQHAGWLTHHQPELMNALHLARYLVSNPLALAILLEAAGSCCLKRAGVQLTYRVSRKEPPSGRNPSSTCMESDCVESGALQLPSDQ